MLEQVEVAVGAHLAVEDLDVDAVGVHVAQPLVRVAVPGPAPRGVPDLGTAGVRLRRVAAQHLAERLCQRGVVVVVEPGRQVRLHVVVLHADVRIGRDDPSGRHGSMQSGTPGAPERRGR